MTYDSKGARLLREVIARRNLQPCWTPETGWIEVGPTCQVCYKPAVYTNPDGSATENLCPSCGWDGRRSIKDLAEDCNRLSDLRRHRLIDRDTFLAGIRSLDIEAKGLTS